jgi:chemotaxis protein methyltransferase CheR
MWRHEAFDIVFFRNVSMYFTPAAASEVVARIARSLSPDGYLFLGHAENLRGLSHDFHLRHSHETFYYARRPHLEPLRADAPRTAIYQPMEPGTPVLSADTSWFDAIGRASSRIERLSRDSQSRAGVMAPAKPAASAPKASAPTTGESGISPAMDLMKQERFAEALRLLSTAPGAGAQPDALLLRAMLLVSTGDLAGAQELCRQTLRIDDLSAGAHYIMSICREHGGDRKDSIEHSQTAAYLDADFAMAHLQLGRLARRGGDVAAARRELALALGLLSREDASRIALFGGGFSREALMEICRGELKACGGVA